MLKAKILRPTEKDTKVLMKALNQMICVCDDCDYDRTHLAVALKYLPSDIIMKWQDDVAFFTMTGRHGIRVRKDLWLDKEIVFISDRIIPRSGTRESDPFYRFFVVVVLHEVAHIELEHSFDRNPNNEEEADRQAKEWFNAHVEEVNRSGQKPPLLPITCSEIKESRRIVEDRAWTYNSSKQDRSQYLCAFFVRDELQKILEYAESKDSTAEVLMKTAFREKLHQEEVF